jgi:20S proteasome subunit beta 5
MSCMSECVEWGLMKWTGNYDISKMHYEGPGDVPGATGGGYGYDIRVKGKSSANPPPAAQAVPAAA